GEVVVDDPIAVLIEAVAGLGGRHGGGGAGEAQAAGVAHHRAAGAGARAAGVALDQPRGAVEIGVGDGAAGEEGLVLDAVAVVVLAVAGELADLVAGDAAVVGLLPAGGAAAHLHLARAHAVGEVG